jgi:hypothetical protein
VYVEAIKWAMGLVNGDATPRPLPSQGADAALGPTPAKEQQISPSTFQN